MANAVCHYARQLMNHTGYRRTSFVSVDRMPQRAYVCVQCLCVRLCHGYVHLSTLNASGTPVSVYA